MSGYWTTQNNRFKMKIFQRQGVLLIEVLLIIAVLAVALTLIIQSLTASYRALYFTRDYAQARFLLENKMMSLMKSQELAPDYYDEGRFDEPFDKFRYVIKSKEKTLGEDGVMNEATLSILWESGSGEQSITAATFFLISKEEKNYADDE